MKRLIVIAITLLVIAFPILFGKYNLFTNSNGEWSIVHGQSQKLPQKDMPGNGEEINKAKFHKALKAMPNRYIVVYKEEFTNSLISDVDRKGLAEQVVAQQLEPRIAFAAREMAVQHGAIVHNIYSSAIHGFSAQMTEEEAIKLSNNPNVEFVEEDPIISGRQAPIIREIDPSKDPNAQQSLDRIDQRPLALDKRYKSFPAPGVDIYVLDSGINIDHDEFKDGANNCISPIRYDAVDDDNDPITDSNNDRGNIVKNDIKRPGLINLCNSPTADGIDCSQSNHGTGIASIIGGKNLGVVNAVQSGATIFSVRILTDTISGLGSEFIKGMDWVKQNRRANHPSVVNLSIGTDAGPDPAVDKATRALINANITCVVSGPDITGVDSSQESPGRVEECITVGATNFFDDVRTHSQGIGIDLFAPGNTSRVAMAQSPDGKVLITGGAASFSAPYVTGVAAQFLGRNPMATPNDVQIALVRNATTGAIVNLPANTPSRLLYSDLDNYINTDVTRPLISGFSPTSGAPGTTVSISGLGFPTNPIVKFNGVLATNVIVTKGILIKAVVPNGALSGPITITTDLGAVAVTNSDFTNTIAPKITMLSPDNGKPDDPINIIGENLAGTRSITFTGETQRISVTPTSISSTLVTVKVPNDAITGRVVVITSNGQAISPVDFIARVGAGPIDPTLPTITDFTRTGKPGDVVTITGTNLLKIGMGRFTGEQGPIMVFPINIGRTDSSIQFTVPALAAKGPITLLTSIGGNEIATPGDFKLPPRITGITPNPVIAGSSIKINGENLRSVNLVTFQTNTVTMPVTVPIGAIEINLTVPSNIVGNVSVTVTNPSDISAPFALTVNGQNNPPVPPTISSINPNPAITNALITINGTNLSTVTTVNINGNSVGFTPNADGTLSLNAPATAGTYSVTVTNPGGTSSPFTFTVNNPPAPPTIISINPSTVSPGEVISINGTNLSTVTTVRFTIGTVTNSIPVTPGNTSITVNAPSTGGNYSVTVINPAGTSNAVNLTVNNQLPPPTIISINPSTVSPGGVITINGTNLFTVTTVNFTLGAVTNSVPVPPGNTSITINVPNAAGTYSVTVTNSSGTSNAVNLTVNSPVGSPTIAGFNPPSGPAGTNIIITGTNFVNVQSITFNGQPATIPPSYTSTSITVKVPFNATTGAISITTPSGTALSATAFLVVASSGPPQIASINPTSGAVNTRITLTGNNFLGTSSIRFDGQWGQIDGVDPVVVSNNQLMITVPNGAITGPIYVMNAAGQGLSPIFTVTPGNVGNLPMITSFTPTSGSPGTQVIINGSNFNGLIRVRVGLFQMPVDPASVTSTRIVATIPDLDFTYSGKIFVETTAGTAQSAGTLTIRP